MSIQVRVIRDMTMQSRTMKWIAGQAKIREKFPALNPKNKEFHFDVGYLGMVWQLKDATQAEPVKWQ